MSRETFAFTSSTLRSLRLQKEVLDLEDERRALTRQYLRNRTLLVNWKRVAAKPSSEPHHCRDAAIHNAVFTGDLNTIRKIFKDEASVNMIVETACDELAWSSELGLWSLIPKQKYTSALRICAARGYTDCLKHLLTYGADVNAAPGGLNALHDASMNGHFDCTQLLLNHGADPNTLSKEGFAPLHLCTTPETLSIAELLLEYGAKVNLRTKDSLNTPLHVAAKQGLEKHLKLYLCYGADIFLRNREGETVLNATCASAEKPQEAGQYCRIVKKLLECGADLRTAGRKNHTPLHNACGNCHYRIVDMLLQHGASVNISNCAGQTPMDCVLQVVEDYVENEPERIVLNLLNHGAASVSPKMLKLCSMSPQTMEVILNTYDIIPLCDSWMETVPPDV
ncbi:ankyrin repeat and SOCS box protein 16 isoform X2 [Latimeria chalumnae]|nr:PREDICTED: ankyrin repeat and SOCS box protein 16 isoform X2 [Latimeria chalumnae]|eukprot:XP_005992267.1 PREDICTED: ankyrin repeat and SOCS box protein 16 isoform X2 [Latimeria chalumnae]